MNTKGILVVSFGTTYAETRKKTIEVIERVIGKEFSEYRIYRAFTSDMVRAKIAAKENTVIPDVEDALRQMVSDGMTEVLVQPTHIIDGIENEKMRIAVENLADLFESCAIGRPLLKNTEDYEKVADAIIDKLSVWSEGRYPQEKSTAVILMGHGSEHRANESYDILQNTFRVRGYGHIYVSTVEGVPDIDTTAAMLREKSFEEVVLMPFMVVAGDHAVNDMAGNEDDSWKRKLMHEGYRVTCILSGLGEDRQIQRLFTEHVREAMPADRAGNRADL